MHLIIYRTTLVLFITCLHLHANANEWFVGINTGIEQNKVSISRNKNPPPPSSQTLPSRTRIYQFSNSLVHMTIPATTINTINKSEEKTDSNSFFGVRLGKYLNQNLRLYADLSIGDNYTFANEEYTKRENDAISEQVTQKFTAQGQQIALSIDYIDQLFNADKLKFFFGGSIGMHRMEAKLKENHRDNNSRTSKNYSKKDNSAIFGFRIGSLYEFTTNFTGEIGACYKVMKNKGSFDNIYQHEFEAKNQGAVYINLSFNY